MLVAMVRKEFAGKFNLHDMLFILTKYLWSQDTLNNIWKVIDTCGFEPVAFKLFQCLAEGTCVLHHRHAYNFPFVYCLVWVLLSWLLSFTFKSASQYLCINFSYYFSSHKSFSIMENTNIVLLYCLLAN